MNRAAAVSEFFQAGGTLATDARCYVERRADAELLEHLLKGEFCSILTPRQMGKSSLMVRTARKLEKTGTRSAIIDLTAIVESGMSAEAFYSGLLAALIRELKLSIDLRLWWQRQHPQSAVQRFASFITDEALRRSDHPLAIFVDEIDSTLKVDFSDDFFAAIRSFYNKRAREAALNRLGFVLLGVASPSDLIKDQRRTPFNIGCRIRLSDFELEEAKPLLQGIPLPANKACGVLEGVFRWTDGHPYLTQRVCAELVARRTPQAGEVDQVVQELFLANDSWSDSNLQEVRNRLLGGGKQLSAILSLYERLLQGEWILDDERSPLHAALKLSGAVKVVSGGQLKPRNRIYSEVFNRQWLRQALDDRSQKQRDQLKKAFESGWLDESTYQAAMAGLESRPDFTASVRGSGAVAQGSGAVAVAAGRGGIAVGGDFQADLSIRQNGLTDEQALDAYLKLFVQRSRRLPLRGIDVGASDPTSQRAEFDLDNIYVTLNTTTRPEKESLEEPQSRTEKEKPLSALRASLSHPRVVLLGDPGSGKSTFMNHLGLYLALECLQPDEWLKKLPDWPAQQEGLIPVAVVLRDFAAFLAGRTAKKARHLWDFVQQRLADDQLKAAAAPLEKALQKGQALLLLDGLDEIPSADQAAQVRQAILAFSERFPDCRIIVTCRTLSYQDRRWRLPDFPSFELALFDEGQINAFIEHWYAELARLGTVKPGAARSASRRLLQAVRRSDLRPLAAKPLLLTVMALVHAHRGRLPEARALLYEETIDILLYRWDQLKASGEREAGLRPLLQQAKRSDVDLKQTLWQLAFQAHSQSRKSRQTVADISQTELLQALAQLHPDGDRSWALQAIEAMKLRSGLLLERTPGVFTFPHRTFQEYLAGAYLASQANFSRRGLQLAKEGAVWREVILLAAGKLVHHSGDLDKPLALVAELCPSRQAKGDSGWLLAWLAGDVLLEIGLNRVQDRELGRDLLKRVRQRLASLVSQGRLAPPQRAAAGDTLAQLGDPRLEVISVESIEFCLVPAGPFWMESGDGLEINESLESDFWISRFPVSNAQYAAFVKAGGYQQAGYWPEAEAQGWWRDGQFKGPYESEPRSGPYDFGESFSLANRPVVGVSWYEALAFTRWLTDFLAQKGLLPAQWKVRLPSEAQWEKAARGGLQVPVQPVVGFTSPKQAPRLTKNASPQRLYPWGEKCQPQHANYNEAEIPGTNAVGAFPQGSSPYGCLEMSGNVWEWTSSQYRKLPYRPEDGREDPAEAKVGRVIRGGACYSESAAVRCAARLRSYPYLWLRHWYWGFRLVLSPLL